MPEFLRYPVTVIGKSRCQRPLDVNLGVCVWEGLRGIAHKSGDFGMLGCRVL
jgi:hypothetical protein